jgi:mRNA-degrading endonuclease toxin of MazEF toxin-antitoxin module
LQQAGNLVGINSSASLSQIRTISTKRLSRKVGRIGGKNFAAVMAKYIKSIK